MCMKYSNGKGGFYARLCAKTGQAGQHRDLTPEQVESWEWGMFHAEGRARAKKVKRQHTITFDVGPNTTTYSIDDMARYMGASRYTEDSSNHHVCFWSEFGFTAHDIERAKTFGWKRIGEDYNA